MTTSLVSLVREGWSIDPRVADRRLTLRIAGTFDMTASAPLQAYLERVLAEALQSRLLELVFDVTEVYYLGSSCIKAFVTLTASLKGNMRGILVRVLTNQRLDWQERTFSVLARLAPDIVSVERVG